MLHEHLHEHLLLIHEDSLSYVLQMCSLLLLMSKLPIWHAICYLTGTEFHCILDIHSYSDNLIRYPSVFKNVYWVLERYIVCIISCFNNCEKFPLRKTRKGLN